MIDFSKRLSKSAKIKKVNPVEIYDTLDRSSEAGQLRPTQIRVLNKWYTDKKNSRDLIVKLHTGAGKTLIGLLMALSYINNDEGPAIYVCPNMYLMKQACAEARKFGIPFCVVSAENDIPNDFVEGKSVLITYVQKVFNGYSIFGIGNRSMNVGCIVLDDSHACIDSIVGACTIKIDTLSDAYLQIREIFENDLKTQGEGSYQDLLNNNSNVVLPIPYWCWQDNIERVTEILSRNSDDNNVKFAWPLLRDQLTDCFAYISNTRIEVTPMCLPINQFGIFNKAKHRILMSATTQEDTFFIKGLGLSVDAVSNPLIDETYTWSGEKMILIPELICENVNNDLFVNKVISASHDFGIVVLTPSFEKSKKYETMGCVVANAPGNDMFAIIKDFKRNYKNNSLVLANRYDGVDLPDNSCRVLIVDGVPYYDSLADKYEEQCRSQSEIIRIKTIQKIEQGLGRSVRGEKDYSVILVIGSDLIKYIRSVTNQKLFSSQTRRQIEIGFQIADMAKEDLNSEDVEQNVKMLYSTMKQCLERDDGWKAYYMSQMDEIDVSTQSKDNLYEILKKENEAYTYIISRNYEKAFAVIQDIINICEDDAEKGWYLQLGAKIQFHLSLTKSNALQIAAFSKNNQLLKPIEGISYNKIKFETDLTRNQKVISALRRYGSYEEFSIHLEDLLSNLTFGVQAEKFENAFFKIGEILGYNSQRPDKSIRKGPDVLWCVSNNKYVLVECKSEVQDTRKCISKSEAGQMEEHIGWFESEYGTATVLRIMAIPICKLASDAYFSKSVKIIRKRNLELLKKKIRGFFKEFRGYDLASLNVDFVQEQLIAHNLCDDFFIESFVESPYKDN